MSTHSSIENPPLIRHEALRAGQSRDVELSFTSPWCRRYFELSGDINNDLHSENDGYRWVQGTGIVTLVGTMLSIHMPGSIARNLQIEFRRPVIIGNNVKLRLACTKAKLGVSVIEIEIYSMAGDLAVVGTATLGPKPTQG